MAFWKRPAGDDTVDMQIENPKTQKGSIPAGREGSACPAGARASLDAGALQPFQHLSLAYLSGSWALPSALSLDLKASLSHTHHNLGTWSYIYTLAAVVLKDTIPLLFPDCVPYGSILRCYK